MNAQRFINEFKEQGWKMPVYERLYEFIGQPEEVFAFCKCCLFEMKESTVFFQDALSFLTSEDLQELVRLAFENIQTVSKDIIEAVVSHTALQYPEYLHAYLPVIFERGINRSAYYSGYPWRKLPEKDIAYFKGKLLQSGNKEEREALFICLLETRNLPTLNFLKDFCRQLSISEEHFVSYLEDVGFTLENGEIASYCPSKCYHFSFSQQYFLPQNAIHLSARKHPSWHLPAAAHHYQMGGVLQADEANPLIHLLTLDPIPEGVEISLEKVVFGLHIREANEGCGVLFYRHDEDGNPSRIGDKNVPEMQIDFPVLPCGIALAPTPERWQYQSWGSANSRENLFRLGGEPTWVQSAEVPVCPVSGEKMRFLFQMDSNLPDTEGGELLFGSGGVLYAFWCDKTRVSAYVLQCT